MKALYSKVEKH